MKFNDSLLPEKKNYFLSDILIGLIFTIFLISIGVLIAIYFRPLYYLDIGLLEIEETTGLTKAVIKSNYNTLIDYCSPFFKGDLKFEALPSSASGLSHFAEVKVIFNYIHLAALLSFVVFVILVFVKKHYEHYGYLLISAITAVLLPAIVGIACAINFNASFTLMHKIFFRNDDWLFDPADDPIITLLPETYFLHCTLVILFIVVSGSLIALFCYIRSKRYHKTESLQPMKKNYYY